MTEAEIELIVKTLYTQAFNLGISNFEFGVICYKKGMECRGIKESAIKKRVKKLEAQIKKEKVLPKKEIK